MSIEKYDLIIGFSDGPITATVCKDTVEGIFAAMSSSEPLYTFTCIEGDRTVIRMSEVCYIISK